MESINGATDLLDSGFQVAKGDVTAGPDLGQTIVTQSGGGKGQSTTWCPPTSRNSEQVCIF